MHDVVLKWDEMLGTTHCPICRTARGWAEITSIFLLIIFIGITCVYINKVNILIEKANSIEDKIDLAIEIIK